MRQFFATNLSEAALQRRPIDERLQAYQQMYSNLGGMEFKKILKVGKGLMTILVKRGKGELQEFEFEFTAPEPLKINGIGNQTSNQQ